MVEQLKRKHRTKTQRLVTFLFFLLSQLLFSQETPEFFSLTERVLVGERYRLELRIPNAAPADIVLDRLKIADGLQLLSGPNIRTGTWTQSIGRAFSGVIATWDLAGRSPGIWEISSLALKIRSRDFSVRPIIVSVLSRTEAGLKFPLELEWVLPEGTMLMGRSFPLSLRVKNIEFVPQPSTQILPLGSGGISIQLSGGGDVVEKRIGNSTALDLVWGRWLVTTTRAGRITIPSFPVVIGEVNKTTPLLNFEVSPLPESVRDSLAVGVFQYGAELQASETEGLLLLVLEIKGRGNFPILNFPKPDLQGFILSGEEDIDESTPADSGYEGRRRKVYRLAIGDPPQAQITLPGFVSWNPETGRIVTVNPRVERVDQVLKREATNAVNEELPQWEDILSFRSQGLFFDPIQYLSLLPGLLAFFAALFWPKSILKTGTVLLVSVFYLSFAVPGDPEPLRYQQARENFKKGNFDSARVQVEEVLSENPDLPLLRLSMALCYYKDSQSAMSVRELRRLALEGLQHPRAESLEKELEILEGLDSQYKPLVPVPGDNLFIVFALSFDLGFLLLGLGMRKRYPWAVIISFFLFLGTLASGTLGFSLFKARSESSGIVGPEAAQLRKIPENGAETWSTLSRGTTVQYLGKTEGFTRIKTGYGLEGWLKDSDLIPLYLSR